MRIDPTDVFAHTVVSIPLRFCLAWAVGTLGSFLPIVVGHGFDEFLAIGWVLLFFPFYLFLVAFFSGWWAFVALPLLLAWAWRVVVFLKGDGLTKELFWIFMLPYLIAIRASQDAWPWAALIAAAAIFLMAKAQGRSESCTDL
jgi:hypothetical protein